jgi:hypothetical protein
LLIDVWFTMYVKNNKNGGLMNKCIIMYGKFYNKIIAIIVI